MVDEQRTERKVTMLHMSATIAYIIEAVKACADGSL